MSAFPNPGNFVIHFNDFKCLLPSSGLTRSQKDAEATAKTVLEAAGKSLGTAAAIADCFGPAGEIAGAALEIVGSLADLGAGLIDLINWIDTEVREAGGDPDNFYITKTPWANQPPVLIDGSSPGGSLDWLLYPWPNLAPKERGGTIPMNKGCDISIFPLGLEFPQLGQGSAIVMWDWEASKTDKPLVVIPIDGVTTGKVQKTIYNAYYDSSYYVDYSIYALP